MSYPLTLSDYDIAAIMTQDTDFPANFDWSWLETTEGAIDGGPIVGQIPWIEVSARVFEAGTHANPNPIEYSTDFLDAFIRNFYALPAPLDWFSWRRPVQVDHTLTAFQTVGSIRELWRVGTWLWARLRFIGSDIVWRVKAGLFRKLSLAHTGDSIDEITVTPAAFLEEAQSFSKEDPMTPLSMSQPPPQGAAYGPGQVPMTQPHQPNPFAQQTQAQPQAAYQLVQVQPQAQPQPQPVQYAVAPANPQYSLTPPPINIYTHAPAPQVPTPVFQYAKKDPNADENTGAGYAKGADGKPRRYMDESDEEYSKRCDGESYAALAPDGGNGAIYSIQTRLANLEKENAALKAEAKDISISYKKAEEKLQAEIAYSNAEKIVKKYFDEGRVSPSAYAEEIDMVSSMNEEQIARYSKTKEATTPTHAYGRMSLPDSAVPGAVKNQATDYKSAGKALAERYSKPESVGNRIGQ